MKKILAKFLVLTLVVFVFATSCQVNVNPKDDPDDPKNKPAIPAPYTDFYNYPTGRADATGTLRIKSNNNATVLLFTSDVTPANYIGTVSNLDSIKVKLDTQKFWTIVAVDKKTWEEKKDQAERVSALTYYSNIQPYELTLSPGNTAGGGTWIINNPTNYWVALQKTDGSGEVYAVAAPRTQRVRVPIQLNTNIPYVPHFYKELKYEGQVIALSEYDDTRQGDILRVTSQNPTFTTDISKDITPPSANIKPAIFVSNSSDKTVQVYSGAQKQLSNGGGIPGEDFAVVSGVPEIFTGLTAGDNVRAINFSALYQDRFYVTQDMAMQNNKVYKIFLEGSFTGGTQKTRVEEVDGDVFYQ